MALFVAIALGPACIFYAYVLWQFWRENIRLKSDRARNVIVVRFPDPHSLGPQEGEPSIPTDDSEKVFHMEAPQTGPVPVMPIRSGRDPQNGVSRTRIDVNYIVEAIERTRAS